MFDILSSGNRRFTTVLQMDVPIIEDDACAERWGDFLPETEVCAGYRKMPKVFCPVSHCNQ